MSETVPERLPFLDSGGEPMVAVPETAEDMVKLERFSHYDGGVRNRLIEFEKGKDALVAAVKAFNTKTPYPDVYDDLILELLRGVDNGQA